jgi:thymidylate synthase
MRIYKNCKQALNEIKRNLYEMGVYVHADSMQNKIVKGNKDFSTKELQNEVFTILDTSDKDEMVGKDLEWCKAEFSERISRKDCNPGSAWLLRKSTWEPFMKDGIHDYTYAAMMKHQIDPIIEELKKNPDSRQCVIELHGPEDYKNMGGKKRIPCSLEYVFQIRNDALGIPKLNIIYTMRSCDYYSHFRNDIWLACELRDYIAKEVSVEPGYLCMHITSLHMYRKNIECNVY